MSKGWSDGGWTYIPVTFTRPIIDTGRTEPISYILEKKSNHRLSNPKTLKMHFLNWLEDRMYQVGFGYEFMPNFPRVCLPMVTYLHELNLIAGFDIDDYGFVTYDKDHHDESYTFA